MDVKYSVSLFKHAVIILLLVLLQSCVSGNVSALKELAQWRASADKAYAEKEYGQALDYYLKIADVIPDEAEIWFRIGNTHNRLGDYEKALAAYKETLVRDSTYSKAWYNSSLIELKKAANLFHESTQHIKPSDPVYAISQSSKEALVNLVKHNNEILNLSLQPQHTQLIDPSQVEIIVLDQEAKKIKTKKQLNKAEAEAKINKEIDKWFAPLKMEQLLSSPPVNSSK